MIILRPTSSFLPSGVTRAADGSISTASPVKTIGWSANPAFPGTIVVNNGIQMVGSASAVLNISGSFYATYGQNLTLAAYVGGVIRGSSIAFAVPAYSEVVRSGSIPITVADGEVVDLYAWGQFNFGITVRAGATWSIVPA